VHDDLGDVVRGLTGGLSIFAAEPVPVAAR